MSAVFMEHPGEPAAELKTMTVEHIGITHARKKDNKFIAANASFGIVLPKVLGDGLTNFAKNLVTKKMTECVVDGFEVVCIDNQQAGRTGFGIHFAQGCLNTGLNSPLAQKTG